MTETWYETSRWGDRITPVKVERNTNLSVWINGCRRARCCDYSSIYPTWKEAHGHVLSAAQKKLNSARHNFMLAQSEYEDAKVMKEPAND